MAFASGSKLGLTWYTMTSSEQTAPPLLSIKHAYKRAGTSRVLENASLSLVRGTTIILLGESGAGKSTLLRAICGLEHLDNGSIEIAEGDGPPSRTVGYLPQNALLFPYLTVADNVGLGMRRRGLSEAQVKARVHRTLDDLAILNIAHELPRRLPTEAKISALIARTIADTASLFAFDEPFVGASPDWKVPFLARLASALVARQATSIFTSHDHAEAKGLNAKAYILSDGTIGLAP